MTERNPSGWEIIVGGRTVKWDHDTITYEQAKDKWDELRPDATVLGEPPIIYKRESGESGILRPSDKDGIKVEDGLQIKVDPSHLA